MQFSLLCTPLPGVITLKVRQLSETDTSTTILFTIRDTGIGASLKIFRDVMKQLH